MNLIPASLTLHGTELLLKAGPLEGALPPAQAALYASATQEPAILGLRAEDVLSEPSAGTLPVTGRVVVREALGAENLIGIETAGGVAISARTGRHFLPAFGDQVTLHADMAQMHLFRASDGKAWPRRTAP
ncbi:TOBE domain-containing protein [Pseudomonas sp. GX19020]|nr:TOBE domain-containing protein [Pseudomonas sp. GX19020]